MFLDRRQKEIVKAALNDYDFIKEEIEEKIQKNYNLEEISEFLVKFKGIEITGSSDYEDEAYLDFNYNNVNMYVAWNKEKGIFVNTTFEIWDADKQEYIIEDFNNKSYYKNLIEKPKELVIADLVADLKHYDSCNKKEQYENCKNEIIHYLKEEF